MLWVGLTRHLVLSRGVKAIVTPHALARKLRIEDLGLAGAAVAQGAVSVAARQYLEGAPETRLTPPSELLGWISSVLSKGAEVGFVKQQRGLRDVSADDSSTSSGATLFELSHDTLGDVLQQFSVEFESWLRFRWYMLWAVFAGTVLGLPGIALAIAAGVGIQELLIFLLFGGLYVLAIWIARVVGRVLYRVIAYPILRRLARGEIPLPKKSATLPPVFQSREDVDGKSGRPPSGYV